MRSVRILLLTLYDHDADLEPNAQFSPDRLATDGIPSSTRIEELNEHEVGHEVKPFCSFLERSIASFIPLLLLDAALGQHTEVPLVEMP